MTPVDIRHFHLFAGLGGGARGFNRGEARVGNLVARFRCLGGIDVDPGAMRDFERLAGVPGTVLDLFDREQYRAFHGRESGLEWREATPQDIQRAAGGERPHIVFLSAPCKGFSGLLSEAKSRTDKYQALNRLTLRGVWLMLEAWTDDPPELVLFENVPRLATRGRALLDQITAMLRSYGYATAETTHDCGELGGLAQSRKRFLLVARHIAKVPPLLYEPERRPLRAVGEVLGRMLLPGDLRAGPMHRVPALQWKTWMRLAFVEAGADWRSLNKLAVTDGVLRDYLVVPAMHRGGYGVRAWNQPCGTVQGESRPSNGAYSVADPRPEAMAEYQQYGVRRWGDSTGAISAQSAAGGGAYSVADPRCPGVLHNNAFRVVRHTDPAQAVTGGKGSVGGCVADPRPAGEVFGKYAVVDWCGSAGTVISGSTTGQGAYAVADPRSGMAARREAYLTGGHYGVLPWNTPSGAVSAAACHDNGRWSVADPRTGTSQVADVPASVPPLPAADAKLVAVITAADGTWHRPFTTLELAALQSLVDPEEQLELDGLSDSAWRERIGNAVPSDAAQAIASEMGRTLLLAWSGETFALSAAPVWVRPVAVGLSVAQGQASA
jgi:site-specific DNA-cytosine methylase